MLNRKKIFIREKPAARYIPGCELMMVLRKREDKKIKENVFVKLKKIFRFIFFISLVWVCKGFYSIEMATAFLNSLSSERAIEAKLISSEVGTGYSLFPYFVIYRDEK